MLSALLVDDNPEFGSILEDTLNLNFMGNAQVSSASSIACANSLLNKGTYDLVILDVRLSSENGLQLIPLIQSSSKGYSTIIVWSNFDYPEYEYSALDAGADLFYSKCSDSFGLLLDHITSLLLEKTPENTQYLQ